MAIYDGDAGNNTLIGGSASDELNGFGGNDFIQGGDGVYTVLGGSGNDTMSGNAGNDWLRGGTGNDSVTGGGGQYSFAFADFGAGNADVLTDGAAMTAIGPSGEFAAGDARFWTGAAAHDADDRVIFNSANGQLLYDADGTGAAAAQLVATVSGTVVATDIAVDNGSATPPPPPPPSGTNGTEGNDTMSGTAGNDYIQGQAGADRITGGAGNDTIGGNEGADTLEGGLGNDALSGGGAQDFFVFREAGAANTDSVSGFGSMASGDARFWAAAGATAGHDADDRVIYNTTTGQLYYDADGSGAVPLAAPDITVI